MPKTAAVRKVPRVALATLDTFEFSEIERKLLECLEDLRGFPRHAFANALVHLGKAYILMPIDREMAIFRAITAEEEAAASLIVVLRQLRYRNAKRLNFGSHLHKLGLNEFIDLIGNHFGSISGLPALRLKVTTLKGRRRLLLQIQFGDTWFEPMPPLNFYSRDDASMQVYLFSREIEAKLATANVSSLKDYLKEIAGVRNRLLYASELGRPEASSPDFDQILRVVRSRVFRYAALIGLLYPYRKERALFVQQSIDAFLASVEGVEVDMGHWASRSREPSRHLNSRRSGSPSE